MAYDNSSLTGDEICDYYYDIENNFMNPPSPTGYFMYKVIGGAFDWLNDLITQFRIDYSILDCNVGNVEIVKSFPEEPDTTHTYYIHQYNTSTDACFTKYSYVDGEWVSETVTGDVLNSLDVFWGRSYNLPRPLLYEGQKADYLFIDNCTSSNNKSDGYFVGMGTYTFEDDGMIIDASTFSSGNYQANLRLDGNNVYTVPFEVSFDLINDGNDNFRCYFYNTNFQNSAIGSGSLWTNPSGEVTKVRFVVTEDGITRYINNTPTTLNLNQDVAEKVGVRFGYSQPTQSSIKLKNYKVYKGEEKERPLNDEEYRIYLYLKNHQLLTMKDLLVAFTNAFGSAETSTTILNSIHTVDHKTYDNPQFSNDSLMAYDDEDMDITTDKLVDKDGVNLINNRLAQGTTSILIPDDGWDEEFLSLLESFISIKGNILISQGG